MEDRHGMQEPRCCDASRPEMDLGLRSHVTLVGVSVYELTADVASTAG